MTEIIQSIKAIAKKLLTENKVSVIIGFAEGSLPVKPAPVFIEKAEDVEKLIWNEMCNLNLVRLIPTEAPTGKIGIILRNCEIKSFVVMVNEHQLKRDDFLIIGVPCQYGKLNTFKLEAELAGKEILEFAIEKETITLKGNDFTQSFKIEDYLNEACVYCQEKVPKRYDFIAEPSTPDTTSSPNKNQEFDDVVEFEKLSPDERWEYISKELEKCNRCYACRNACPLCYCKTCFVDVNQPQWFSKANDLPETILFHLTRAMHLAGRCTECGACTSACPEGINIHIIFKRLQQAVEDRWNYRSGVRIGDSASMGTYKPNDPQEFIVEED
ncbi:MAG: 4Fe-4S dicluster domain-containing protein [Candidatus Heimdallarchaeota archaeon]|nr:4Fe-4S dicluster domain-containing protein [Candidatus Heimdallarchaeota archaeon]